CLRLCLLSCTLGCTCQIFPYTTLFRSLVSFAEENGVENASTMRKQELMFAILKQLAIAETDIIGEGVVEVLSDGFGFLRSPDAKDRKSTRLNSSHVSISYAVFCLKHKI